MASTHHRYWAVLSGCLAIVACRSEPAALRIDAIEPASGFAGESVSVVIRGSFAIEAQVSYADEAESRVWAVFTAQLGEVALQTVTYVDASHLAAVVSPDLAAGTHDLTVIDPRWRRATLASAFTVRTADTEGRDDGGDSDRPSDGGDSAPEGDPISCSGNCSCQAATCSLDCPSGGCLVSCANDATCSGTCASNCTTTCANNSTCDFQCGSGCTYNCAGSATCTVTCDSDCTISSCAAGASCVLTCTTDDGNCTIRGCPLGHVRDCGNGVKTCRAACP